MTPTDALIEKMAMERDFEAWAASCVGDSEEYVIRRVKSLRIARAAYSAEHEEDGK